MNVAYPTAAASSQAADSDASVALKQVALIKRRELLRRFSRALDTAQEEADKVLDPAVDIDPDLDICPDGDPNGTLLLLASFCSDQTRAWMIWIALHRDEDDFDMGEFKKFASGLLASPTEAQKTATYLGDYTPLDQCLYSWLLEKVSKVASSPSAYARLSNAVYEARKWYANVLCYYNNLDAFAFEPTNRARKGSNVSDRSNCEEKTESDDDQLGSESESGMEDSKRPVTASLSASTV